MEKKWIWVIVILILLVFGFGTTTMLTNRNSRTIDTGTIGWEDDGIVLMQHETEGDLGCFGCGETLCVDPIPEMELVEETIDRYCESDFTIVENRALFEEDDGENFESPRVDNLGKRCEGTKTKFDYAPVNLEKTLVFQPLGLMTGGHVTPIDHHYFQNFGNDKPDIEVYSPGSGFVTSIGHMPGAPEGEDYRVVISHTCTIESIYIHIDILSEELASAIGKEDYASVEIPVEAGELIGYYATNVDYNLVDAEVTLDGFVIPEHYSGEAWKIHVPNTYDYFNEPVKSQIIAISLRSVEPISGKIDYDIDGKLVGNWFLEGTGGYAGGGTGTERYWLGHLAIAYDAYDPTRIVFSIGNYEGKDSEQFGVKNNAPDPAAIGIKDGMIKYELVDFGYVTSDGKDWDRTTFAEGITGIGYDSVRGVVLVEMVDSRKIKFEVFPGKTAGQVSGFTDNSKIYKR